MTDATLAGVTAGLSKTDVSLNHLEFTQHAAFLGGSGSGKTTAALNIIEQLALNGIPAILIDRKGDLCGYGGDEWLNESVTPELAARRQQLRAGTKINVFTPGNASGRDLTIPLTPPD